MTDLASPQTTEGFLDDEAMVRRILAHLDNGTTDLSDDTWREPVANYRSPARLALEVEQVLRRYPTPFCPSAALPEPGSYLARDAAGTPLVAVRGSDEIVRVFRNSCRHRGTAIARDSGCAKSLVCPYHGWVYRLDGALRHVPDEYGFPGLDKETRGLVPVLAEERAGLVFVTQDGSRRPENVPEVFGPGQELIGSGEVVVEANWKVFLEGFLEGYHIKSTHPETFFPFGYDNVNVVEHVGPHSRVTFPFRRVEALRDKPSSEWNIEGLVTSVYHLFPNVIVARLSHFTSMAILEPLDSARTRLVTYAFSKRRDAAQRDSAFVNQGTIEDRDMALRVQRGLASGANETVEFGHFEGAIVHFYRQLNSRLPTSNI